MNSESVFSLGNILTGINKTLGIANQVIPLYQQTKPLFRNAKTAYEFLKNKPIKKTVIQNIPKEKPVINNQPQFFI